MDLEGKEENVSGPREVFLQAKSNWISNNINGGLEQSEGSNASGPRSNGETYRNSTQTVQFFIWSQCCDYTTIVHALVPCFKTTTPTTTTKTLGAHQKPLVFVAGTIRRQGLQLERHYIVVWIGTVLNGNVEAHDCIRSTRRIFSQMVS
jgi:hypothetical protein